MTAPPLEIDTTREQLLATDGHLLVEGGPGCGKTTIALLRAQRAAPDLAPGQEIVFLSFSRAAVRQILDRTRTHLDADTAALLKVRTFHALFIDIVVSHAHLLTGRPAEIITPDQENQLRATFDGDWAQERTRLAAEGKYVFDEIARVTADLLEQVPAVRRLFSDRFPLVIVDEFQDTTADQWRAVHAFAEGSTIIALADPDQRIYEGFVPGVDEHRISHLVDALTPARFDLSASNFRSPGGSILDFGNAVLRNQRMPEPDQVQTVSYPGRIGAERATQFVLTRVQHDLTTRLGAPPTIAVLATSNGFLAGVSAALSSTAVVGGQALPAIEHDLLWDPQLSAAAGLVIASVLSWPGKDRDTAIITMFAAIADYYRTKIGTLVGRRGEKSARNNLKKVGNAAASYAKSGICASKLGKAVIAAVTAGVRLNGNPVTDWRTATSAFTGSPELDEIAGKARTLPLVKTSNDLSWALHDEWNGTRYAEPVTAIQQVLAADLLNGLGHEPAGTILMTMHRSKGKEFDAVLIVEGLHRAQLADWRTSLEEIRRRRLLRVAITRARHNVVFVRPRDAPSLFT